MKFDLDKTFVTSDQHFAHKNIIRLCNRPYATVEAMDADLIRRWNWIIGPDDVVFHLGDFTLGSRAGEYFSKLNGRIVVLGNYTHHDKRWINDDTTLFSLSGHEVTIGQPIIVLYPEQFQGEKGPLPLVLCHFPLAEFEHAYHGAIHLHGHSHCNYAEPLNFRSMDVGVDCNDFYPHSLREIFNNFSIKLKE